MNAKFALAALFRTGEDNYLFGLRSEALDEYPGKWSLPSVIISETDFLQIRTTGRVPQTAFDKLCQKCFENRFPTELRYLRSGTREREGYRLHLALVHAELDQPPLPKKTKYQRLEAASIHEVLAREHGLVGACISLLIQEMVEAGKLEPAIRYLEIPPHLAVQSVDINKLSPTDLWKLAIPNYSLLRAGESGSDGELIRSRIVDQYITRRISGLEKVKTSILDVGCGDGGLVSQLAKNGYRCSGVDIDPDPLGRHEDENLDLRCLRAEDLGTSFRRSSFSLVIMNLVVQWIQNLEGVIRSLALVTRPNARIVVTLVPPEFSKNGHWDQSSDTFDWVIDQPIRRGPFLTMINRTVGPVWYFPRTIPDYINAFSRAGMPCVYSEYLYIDSFLDDDELDQLYSRRPDLKRHERIPAFLVLEFERN